MRNLFLLWLTVSLFTLPAHATPNPDSFDNDPRYRQLIGELRCLVCQNQAIADSDAPLAVDLRNQVKAQLAEGKSDTEIVQYLTDRYGDFVRYRPPVKPITYALWFAPLALLLLALGWAWRRSKASPAPAPRVDEAALAKILKEHG
jgi:cytochrome c-type biogenesis protein CcmH